MIRRINSTSIDVLRSWAIVLVVVLHARTGLIFSDASHEKVADFISWGIAAVAVPLFFAISGFLSSCSPVTRGDSAALKKFLRRLGTLVFVYGLWNLIIFSIAAVGELAHLHIGDFLSQKVHGGVLGVLGLDSQFPIAYQFWFIRELIVMSAVFFLVSLALPRDSFYVALVVALMCLSWLFLDERTSISVTSYGIGAAAGRLFAGGIDINILTTRSIKWVVGFVAFFTGIVLFENVRSRIFLNIFMLAGCCSAILFCAQKTWSLGAAKVYKKTAGAAFFMFAAHEPLLSIFKRGFLAHASVDSAYVLSPVLTVAILYGAWVATPIKVREKYWFVFSGTRKTSRNEN